MVRVVLISVFVGRDGRPWTDFEIARGHEALELGPGSGSSARRAVARSRWSTSRLAETYFQVEDDSERPRRDRLRPTEGDDVGPLEAGAIDQGRSIGASLARRPDLGFEDVVDLMVSRINPRVDADARVWLFHLRRAGRSLAIPAAEQSDVPGVGLAVCFAREASFPEPLIGARSSRPDDRGPRGPAPVRSIGQVWRRRSDSFPTGSVTYARHHAAQMRSRCSKMTIDDADRLGNRLAREASDEAHEKRPPLTFEGWAAVRKDDESSTISGGPGAIGSVRFDRLGPSLARVLARFAASKARRASAYLARGAECVPSP